MLSLTQVFAQADGDDAAERKPGSWIVRLKSPSVVIQTKSLEKSGRLLSAAEKLQVRQAVESSQSQFEQKLLRDLPGKRITHRFKTILNALVLEDLSEAEAKALLNNDSVLSVSPNYKVRTQMMLSVSLTKAKDVWPLNRNEQPCGFSQNDAYLSQSACMNGSGIRVGIIDTGIDYFHPDLGGCRGPNCRVKGGWNVFTLNDNFMDDQGHGTHVAGIVAGRGVAANGVPINGIAPNADLYGIKVLDHTGGGTFESVAQGIEWSVDPNQDGDLSDHLDVINLSIGGPVGNPEDIMSIAVDEAVEAGVVAVVAAGNAGSGKFTINSPGTSRRAITVGAMNQQSQLAWFSSKGPAVWRDGDRNLMTAMKPEVVAPGVSICAARASQAWSGFSSYCEDQKHVRLSGTSMATPMVTGAVALMLQRNPSLTPQQIKNKLQSTAQRVRDSSLGPIEIGAGFLNAYRATFADNPSDIGVLEVKKADHQLILEILGKRSNVEISFAPYKPIHRLTDQSFKRIFSGSLNSESTTLRRPMPRGESFILKVETSLPSSVDGQSRSVQYQYFMDEWPICRMNDIFDISRRAAGDYKQTCDLEITSDPEYSIGGFTGNYNGYGRRVVYKLPPGQFVAWPLFSLIKPRGSVRNLRIENIQLRGFDVVGGLAQYSYGGIENVSVTGRLESSSQVGGIVGIAGDEATVRKSAVRADIVSAAAAGGLIGTIESETRIEQSYFKGSIQSAQRAGGIVAEAFGSGSLAIHESYVSGSIQGEMTSAAIVGESAMPIQISTSFWDEDLAPDLPACVGSLCEGAIGLSSSQMTDSASFSEWDFRNVWNILNFETTPFHQWE